MVVTETAVRRAFDHLATLALLHYDKTPGEHFEAMLAVMESFNMDEDAREELTDCVIEFIPTDTPMARGWILLGFLAGMSAAQDAVEAD